MVSQSKLHKMKGKKDNLGWENLEIILEDKKIFGAGFVYVKSGK